MPYSNSTNPTANHDQDTYILNGFNIKALNSVFIVKHCEGTEDTGAAGYYDLHPEQLQINFAAFTDTGSQIKFPQVNVRQHEESLILSCRCLAPKSKLCTHQARVLFNLMNRPEIRIFFDQHLRHNKIRTVAADYGLEHEQDPDALFEVLYEQKKIRIVPLIKDLFPVTTEKSIALQQTLLPKNSHQLPKTMENELKKILVLKEHKYYAHFQVDLMECSTTANGKIRNPLTQLNAMDFLWAAENVHEIKFFTAISRFQQNNYETEKAAVETEGLKALVKNPIGLDVFYHDKKISANLTASSVIPVKVQHPVIDIVLSVSLKKGFYTISGELILAGKAYQLHVLNLKYQNFVFYNQTLYLIGNPDVLRVIDFFRQNNNHLVIHESKYATFQQDILAKLENQVRINYAYLKPATEEQLKESHFDREAERIIYLSDGEQYVLITPVMKYGSVEVPVLSRKQIFAKDQNGQVFSVNRQQEEELRFLTFLGHQHPDFQEQLDKQAFYLHKKHFIDEGWFLTAFEQWQEQHITVLGFNELTGNKINHNKAKITIEVISGINWFDSNFEVKFGQQKVSLKTLHRAIRNKSKFVKLGDGTMGLLPQEWIDKFTEYFNAGEVTADDVIRTPKVNFSAITDLYQDEMLSATVKMELSAYKKKISGFKNIEAVEVPKALNGTLRDYQKEGLNWLNFLDEFGFGGCLADDMGLGKTIQIIAFILSQREKNRENTNLIVVPTTLIFNWQQEIAKFAPDIKVYTIYGADRIKESTDFSAYEIVLTSYGTLLYDVGWLKKYFFNYIFLDESQTIKNPESLRYHAVRLLQSRNKIAMTGTPIENNTFDLYGQLSFACPGLLGSKQFFREHYSTPIDKFKDNQSAIALKKKVSPFILRRTKKEVASELPDKTEMVIYCEMGTEQKDAYDACKNEYLKFLMGEKDEDITRHTLHMLKGLTQLRQICNSPALLKDDLLLHGASSSKIDTLMEEIQSHSPQHKILVFSQFVSMLNLIRKELQNKGIPFEYLTGQTRNRQNRVANFQENDDVRVFLISLKAGGTGLNLTQADYVYLVDPWWNPAVENQAIDRCYRIGQKKNVVAVRLICPDTIEEKIMKLQETKKELVSDIIKTDSSLMKSLTKNDLIALFS